MEEWKPKTWSEQYLNNLSLEPQSLTCLHCCNVSILQQAIIKGPSPPCPPLHFKCFSLMYPLIIRTYYLMLTDTQVTQLVDELFVDGDNWSCWCDEKWGYRRCWKDPLKSWIEDDMTRGNGWLKAIQWQAMNIASYLYFYDITTTS